MKASSPFKGHMFVKNKFSSCRVDIENSETVELALPFREKSFENLLHPDGIVQPPTFGQIADCGVVEKVPESGQCLVVDKCSRVASGSEQVQHGGDRANEQLGHSGSRHGE